MSSGEQPDQLRLSSGGELGAGIVAIHRRTCLTGMQGQGMVQTLSTRSAERLFFTCTAAALSGVLLGAFVPSFFLRDTFHRPAPSPFIALHGLLMAGWVLLFLLQNVLVAVGRTAWHRQLGYAGVAFAALLVPIGCMATLAAAAREVHAHSPATRIQLNVLGLELTQMGLFGGFVAAATILRRRVDYHKRLMLVATLCVLPNAIARFSFMQPFQFLSSNFLIMLAWMAVLGLILAVDTLRTGRLHAAFIVGMPLAAASVYAAWAFSLSAGWVGFWVRSLS